MNIINKIFQKSLNSLINLGVLSNIKSYSGDYKNGLYHGKGRLEFKDGSVYEGQFENNKMHGYGKIFFKDGSIYQGNFKNDLRDETGLSKDTEGNLQRVVYQQGKFKELYTEEFIFTWEKNLQGSIVVSASNVSDANDKVMAFSNEELIKNSDLDTKQEKFKLIDIAQEV